jgi:ABC-type transport system involved in multi-copper enzyme maturation permease subunit
VKSYQILTGIVLFFIGIFIFIILSNPESYLGLLFILGAIVSFAFGLFKKQHNESDQNNYRSKTREQILKHKQHKIN